MTAPDHALEPFKKTTCTKGGIHTCANRLRGKLPLTPDRLILLAL